MKLTKAQRLFISVGKIEYKITRQKNSCCSWVGHQEDGDLIIKKLKARRKKLIREALRAYELETGDAFSAGVALARACENSDDSPMVIKEDDQTIIF